MDAMKKLFGIVMLMMLSISVSAEEQSKVTVDIGEFEGGTITENLEKSQKKNEADGTYEIVITVKPDEGFIITKNDIVVMATIPAKTRTEGNGPELAEKLTLTGDEPDDPSKERDYSVTVKEGFGVWIKEANFHTSSLVIGSDTREIEEGKLAGVTTITIKNEEQIVSLGNNDVTGKTVIVPGNLYNEYKTTDGWKEATINADEGSTTMEGVVFTANNDYTAFFSKEPLKVPSVLHAYMITGLDNDGNLVLTEVEGIIPGGTAVLLYSEKIDDNDFRTVVSTEDGQAVGGKNPLQVVTEGAGKDVKVGEVYMLYNDVFYYTQAGTIPQNGIYLDPNVLNDNGQPVKSRARLLIGGTGNTTGISDVITNDKARTNSEVWYTLDGRQLNGTPGQKGIYIRNGKKMVVTK